MKTSLLRLLLSALLTAASLRAADEPRLAAVRAADDERIAATLAADKEKLAKILSDDLHYAHSNGGIDTKASLMDALASGKMKYLGLDYDERKFALAAPGIALMSGRVRLKASNPSGAVDVVLSFLAVWREEKGQWRFLAWQSCKIPPPAPPAK